MQKYEGNKDNTRINEQITAPELRVLGPEKEPLGVLSLKDALKKSEEMGFDLVEISPGANPPVARIVDYGKFVYQREKKLKEAKKSQHMIEVKEVKFGPHIDVHDFEYRTRRISDFLEKGNKVKVSIRFRGREMAHTKIGFDLIKRIIDLIGEDFVERPAKLESRQILLFLAPKSLKKK